MKTAEAGRDLIKLAEGLALKAYPDPATHGEPWTIGYGHTSRAGAPAVHAGMTITAIDAERILIADLAVFEAAVMKALIRQPSQNQFDALVSLCFNIGAANFAHSHLIQFFNAGSLARAANAFLNWDHANGHVMPGLTKRRRAERNLFLKP
ncbi:MAG: lysozyme [Rhizobiales bacterium]|nr:lysozyme [Hyphomicrobiales bacterium]